MRSSSRSMEKAHTDVTGRGYGARASKLRLVGVASDISRNSADRYAQLALLPIITLR
jgi:hypothetical protein